MSDVVHIRDDSQHRGHRSPRPEHAEQCGEGAAGWMIILVQCYDENRMRYRIGTSWPPGGRPWDGAWRRIEAMLGLRET